MDRGSGTDGGGGGRWSIGVANDDMCHCCT